MDTCTKEHPFLHQPEDPFQHGTSIPESQRRPGRRWAGVPVRGGGPWLRGRRPLGQGNSPCPAWPRARGPQTPWRSRLARPRPSSRPSFSISIKGKIYVLLTPFRGERRDPGLRTHASPSLLRGPEQQPRGAPWRLSRPQRAARRALPVGTHLMWVLAQPRAASSRERGAGPGDSWPLAPHILYLCSNSEGAGQHRAV